MIWLEIRPQDVWLFRDGKPFSAGEDHSAYSMFPPTPLTVQGALRQKISVSLGVSFYEYKQQSTPEAKRAAQYIGNFDERLNTGNFRMTGPFVGLRTSSGIVPLVPVPADLFKHEDHHDFFISEPSAMITSDLAGNYSFPQVVPDYENLPTHWMTADIFSDYLDGIAPDQSVFFVQDDAAESENKTDIIKAYEQGQRIWPSRLIYQSENRFGVSTDAIRSFRDEGLLYQVQFIRPHLHISLLASVEGIPETDLLLGTMSLGGEHRLANVLPVEQMMSLPVKPTEVLGQFKMVLLTPAYFENGWQPENWSNLFRHPVEFIGAALYRPQRIGGWNIAANRARTMHNYVSPGSVYYFKTDTAFTPPVAFTQTPKGIENAAFIGFGQYAIGQWNLE